MQDEDENIKFQHCTPLNKKKTFVHFKINTSYLEYNQRPSVFSVLKWESGRLSVFVYCKYYKPIKKHFLFNKQRMSYFW